MNEAARLVLEGEPVEVLDGALLDFGFPVGPITLLDEVGIDVGPRSPILEKSWVARQFQAPKAFDKLLEDDRRGRKERQGLLPLWQGGACATGLTGKEGKKTVDASVHDVLGVKPQARLARQEIAERCVLLMLNEAAMALDSGVVASARTATSAPSSASASRRSWAALPLHGQPRHRLSGGAPRAPSEALWRPLCPCARLQAMAAEQQRSMAESVCVTNRQDGLVALPLLSRPGLRERENRVTRGLNLIWRKLVPHLLLWWHRTQARVEVNEPLSGQGLPRRERDTHFTG